MFDILCEFSRNHCIAICAVLVPANLTISVQNLIFTALGLPKFQIRLTAAIATLYATLMLFHVLSWFMVGVVMVPTYILLCLVSICLGINAWAIARSPKTVPLLRRISIQS